MPTGSITQTKQTLSSYAKVEATMQFTEPTALLSVTATYELDPGNLKFQTRGGTVEVNLLPTAKDLIKRDIPRLDTGYETDDTAKQTILLSAKETTTNKTTCVTTTGATDAIGTFDVFDSRWPVSRLTGTAPLSNRGFLAKLPAFHVPVCLSVYSDVAASEIVQGDLGPITIWEADADEVTNIAMGYDTVSAGNTFKEITVNGNRYRNEFDSCLTHLLLTKEIGGNYLAVGFNESVGQPSTQKAFTSTFPPQTSDIDRPYLTGAEERTSLQLIRENIKADERQTFRAFMQGQKFWIWLPELNDYRPIDLTFANAFDNATTELTVNLTINAY